MMNGHVIPVLINTTSSMMHSCGMRSFFGGDVLCEKSGRFVNFKQDCLLYFIIDKADVASRSRCSKGLSN